VKNIINEPQPFEELQNTGLLWLINRIVFHPRGYALAFNMMGNKINGWSLLGDGSEVWTFKEEDDDECFAKVKALFESTNKV
jgi:hypothetical protein